MNEYQISKETLDECKNTYTYYVNQEEIEAKITAINNTTVMLPEPAALRGHRVEMQVPPQATTLSISSYRGTSTLKIIHTA
jgi:hypothetical protein